MSQDQEEIIVMPSSYSGGGMQMPQSPRISADLLDKIKGEQIVEIVRHRLLGEDWDGEKWVKVAKLQKRAISEIGAWELSTLMLSVSSISMSISKIPEHRINKRLRGIVKEAMVKMLVNWKEYNVTDVSQFWFVKGIIFSHSMAVLSQAGEGSIQDVLKRTIYESHNINKEEKKPSRWGGLFGGFKRQ